MPKSSIYTIGHSNSTLQYFIGLLTKHQIDVLVDVRSVPSSNYSPQFHQIHLKEGLAKSRTQYLFLGRELGGRPTGNEFYDPDGRVLYGEVAKTNFFHMGIQRLKVGLERYRIAMMCSEEDPTNCHRRLLVARVLKQDGIDVFHIRRNGDLESEDAVALRDPKEARRRQMGIFEPLEEAEWKSVPSVLQKRQPSIFLNPSDETELND